jgi:hypothetical protein
MEALELPEYGENDEANAEPVPRASMPAYRPDATAPAQTPWSRLQRVLFRFVLLYFFAYSAQSVAGLFPTWLSESAQKKVAEHVFGPWSKAEDDLVLWTGAKFFGLKITVRPAGSGDTTWNYVQLVDLAAIAVAGTLLWTLLDELLRMAVGWGPGHHRRLRDWLRVWLRFVLGVTLIGYGCAKVIPSQMPEPGLDRLAQPFGTASPMGLLWTFLGASKGYEMFSGAAELLAGWLLVTRWTTTLGALMAAAVMGNVVALNFFYDTPVKLYSSHLFLMAVALVVPEIPRLARFFVLNRTTPAAEVGRLFPWKWANRGALAFGVFLFGHATWQSFQQSRKYYDMQREQAAQAQSPLQGNWAVTSFELDGAPAVGTEDEAWRRLVVGRFYFNLETVKDPSTRYFVQIEEKAKKVMLMKRGAPNWKATLGWDLPEPDKLQIEGKFDGHDVFVEFKRSNVERYLLMTRGFHWINEYPDNE